MSLFSESVKNRANKRLIKKIIVRLNDDGNNYALSLILMLLEVTITTKSGDHLHIPAVIEPC